MRNITIQLLLSTFLLCVFSPFSIAAQVDSQKGCTAFGGVKEKVCAISFVSLIANQKAFNGVVIGIRGELRRVEGKYYLFADDYSAKNVTLENSLVCRSGCERLKKLVGRQATLIGRFGSSRDSSLFHPAGEIEVMLIRELD